MGTRDSIGPARRAIDQEHTKTAPAVLDTRNATRGIPEATSGKVVRL